MYRTILVPIDGSDGSNRAAVHALELADRFGADLHAIHVVDTRLYGEAAMSSTELVLSELEDRGEDLLESFVDRADNRDVEVSTRCCHGVPHEEIVEYADEIDADLVVIGYAGQTHESGDHMGSVAERVVRRGGRAVLTA